LKIAVKEADEMTRESIGAGTSARPWKDGDLLVHEPAYRLAPATSKFMKSLPREDHFDSDANFAGPQGLKYRQGSDEAKFSSRI
jgi:hypothetical protein